MVAEYLKKERKKFDAIAKKNRDEISQLETKLIENEKFTSLLEAETQKVFRDFTPRDVDNKNRKQINQLKQDREKLLNRKNTLQDQLDEANAALKELRASISEVKDLEMQAADSRWFEENVYDAGESNEEPSDESLVSGKAAERLKGILEYLMEDPARAKEELEKMIRI